jgi:hypothetical protein
MTADEGQHQAMNKSKGPNYPLVAAEFAIDGVKLVLALGLDDQGHRDPFAAAALPYLDLALVQVRGMAPNYVHHQALEAIPGPAHGLDGKGAGKFQQKNKGSKKKGTK